VEHGVREFPDIVLDLVAVYYEHFAKVVPLFLSADPVRIIDIAIRPGNGKHLSTALASFHACAPCYIAKTRYGHCLSFYCVAHGLEHFFSKIHRAEAGGFWSNKRTSKSQSLASKDTRELIRDSLVLAKHIAYLTAAYSNVACRHICICAYIAE